MRAQPPAPRPSARARPLIPSLLLAAAWAAPGRGGEPVPQPAPLAQTTVAVDLDSGPIRAPGSRRGVAWEGTVEVAGAPWVRLLFDVAQLGPAPSGTAASELRLVSVADGAWQKLDATSLEQWRMTSAYFNGDAVHVQVIASPGAGTSRVKVTTAFAGTGPGGVATICGPTDDRLPADDPRVARKFPSGCSAWLIDDANRCLLSAGHCLGGLEVVEFNVPLSLPDGSVLHPDPEDQYAVDPDSVQGVNQGVGDDWGYFGCFANSTSGLTPFEAQGSFFTLAKSPPAVKSQLIRITGYGSTSFPAPPEWNYVLTTHAGPYAQLAGTVVRYEADTTSGDSGSPVVDTETGLAIGIHTHGSCGLERGSNIGTTIDHGGLVLALANPQGVCAPGPECPADLTGDGAVGVDDLVALVFAWGRCQGACPADLTDDGEVDVDDLVILVLAWGDC